MIEFLSKDKVRNAFSESCATSMVYNPKPIDTSQIRLNAELTELTERLAKNVHDTWARDRLAEGWRYGPSRNDASKEHPNLVPYDQLPEFEREYDRRTALETLRMLLALGYSIESPNPKPAQRRVRLRRLRKNWSASMVYCRRAHRLKNWWPSGTDATRTHGRVRRHYSV